MIGNRNRLIEVNKNLLPMDEESTEIGYRSLTKQQIEYMKEKRTTQLPPWMFKKAVLAKRAGKEAFIKELSFFAFTLTKEFPQNVCLMKDGSIVFCDEFLSPTTDAGAPFGEEKRPLIAGYKFLQVCFTLIRYS